MPRTLSDNLITGDVLSQWTIQEYDRHNRGVLWYIIIISAGLFLVVYGILSNNFLFSLIIILAGIILFIQSYQEPLQVLFQITELGVIVGNRFYSYNELDKFYIIYNPPQVKTLFIDLKNSLRPMLRIPLLDQNPLEVRDQLLEYLDEDMEKEEPRSDAAARAWKIH